MLSERVRNYVVGLTMIAAIGAFMVAVFKLGNIAVFAHGRPYAVTAAAPRADGVVAGTSVSFQGVIVGSVSSVSLSPDLTHVEMVLSIQSNVRIPASAIATVGKPPTIGAAYFAFDLPEDGAAAKPSVFLATDGSAKVSAIAMDGSLIPKSTTDTLATAANDISQLAKHLTVTADALNELLGKQDPKLPAANISVLVQQVNQAVADVHTLLGDPKSTGQIHEILENVATATAGLKDMEAQINSAIKTADVTLDKYGTAAEKISGTATQATATLKTTETQIMHTTEQLSTALVSLNTTLDTLNKGKGTAGMLMNDPRLYEGLVDLTTSLKNTSDDLNTLIQKWKEEGLPLHLK